MKTFLCPVLLATMLGFAHAQEVYISTPTEENDAVEYQPPVVYLAPVVYNGPVVYQAPVTYVTVFNSPDQYAYEPACHRDCEPRSTVVYIGGGQVHYAVSPRCNAGSTITVIGSSHFR